MAKSKVTNSKRVVVTQTRSPIGRDKRFKSTLQALGLGKIGKSCEHVLSPAVVGMIRRVEAVVEIAQIH